MDGWIPKEVYVFTFLTYKAQDVYWTLKSYVTDEISALRRGFLGIVTLTTPLGNDSHMFYGFLRFKSI